MRNGMVACGMIVAALATSGQSAPPPNGRITPIDPNKLKIGPARQVSVDPALIDKQMMFDFRHAVINKQNSSASLSFPGPPTSTTQGAILTLFSRGIVWPVNGDGMSAFRMVFTATNNLATADFRSNAFEMVKRRAVTLDWSGNFEPVSFPIQIRLSFGQDQVIGSVTFDNGNVLVGPSGQEKPIGNYMAANPGEGVPHRVFIRADLLARTYSVRFEQNSKQFISDTIPFPVGTGGVPAGQQQITARLTSPKPYVSGYYDLSQLNLSGEPK